jgi:hypothetical protein
MCIGGGGGGSSGPQYTNVQYTDPTSGQTKNYWVEQGVPGQYAARGATTVAQYQTMASQDISNQQIAAQQSIASQQQAFNEQQLQYQQQQAQQQQDQANQQAALQSSYTTQRQDLLTQGADQINQAFSQFTPDYFNQYAQDYMSKAQDDITYQQQQAQKAEAFQTASQGISDSQANVNQQGLIQEDAGRATAEQTANAQQAEAQLQSNVSTAKSNLLGQVQSAEAIGSPIAGTSAGDVQSSIDTQRSAISGVTSQAGDIVSSLGAVPTVSPLSNIFAGVLGTAGSVASGTQASSALNAFKNAGMGAGVPGLGGTSPGVAS